MKLKNYHIIGLTMLVLLFSEHCHNPPKQHREPAHVVVGHNASIDTFNALLKQAKANSTAVSTQLREEINQVKKERKAPKIYLKMDRNPEGEYEYHTINNQNIPQQ